MKSEKLGKECFKDRIGCRGWKKREKGVYIGHLSSLEEDKQIAYEHFRSPFLHPFNPINSCPNLVHTLAES